MFCFRICFILLLRGPVFITYTSKEFVALFKSVGIRKELTVPHNPQQNGVAERMKISIEETMKALLNDQGLSMFLWGEAAMKKI
jgi:transposase InsO family protein